MKSLDFRAFTTNFFGNGDLGRLQARVLLMGQCDFESGPGGKNSMETARTVVSLAGRGTDVPGFAAGEGRP